ncbi:MAG: hydroxymethylbilane synthase [Parvibaculales bacterium]
MRDVIKIGTRKSPLAMAQTAQFVDAFCAALGLPRAHVEIIGLSTRGDEILDQPLAEIGGKGLFTQELEAGLQSGALDMAVHSLKDLPTKMPEGLALGCVPRREDPRDVLVMIDPPAQAHELLQETGMLVDFELLPEGAVIGSASLRRTAQILNQRPDLETQSLRGNVATRIKKLSSKDGPQATLLAQAGLNRLQKSSAQPAIKQGAGVGFFPLAPHAMLPAAGQGALGIQCRADDAALLDKLLHVDCLFTRCCVTAERTYLGALEGSCRTPIAAFAQIQNDALVLMTRLLSDDGAEIYEHQETYAIDMSASRGDVLALAEELGLAAAHQARQDRPDLLPKVE